MLDFLFNSARYCGNKLSSPNLYIYTGTGATNSYAYSSATHVISFNSSVGNNGDAASGTFVLGWYLSTDMTIGTGDKSITWTPPQSSLAPGSHVNNLSGSMDLDVVSGGLASGTYYAGAYVDDVQGIEYSLVHFPPAQLALPA